MQRTGTGSQRAVRQFEEGASWIGVLPEVVAIIVMVTVLLFINAQFKGLAAPQLLNGWLIFMACCVAARLVTIGLSVWPAMRFRIGPATRVRIGQGITLAFSAGIMASIWILMPPADDLLRMLMIILCMWFIAMVIVLNADRVSVIGALGVVASMAGFVLSQRVPYGYALAGFLVMEGAALVMIRRAMSRSAAKLQSLLAIVQAERDAKTRFIASASHDLQQPLQAARLYFETALTSGEPKTRDRAIKAVRSAFSSTQALLQSMLDHLRLEAGAMPVRPVAVDLREILLTVAVEHEPSARAAAMRIRVFAAPMPMTVDEHLVRRVIDNLLVNALRHSGGTHILIAARRSNDAAEIWVVDNGTGIAPEEADRLFEDFYQGPQQERSRGGFGIGLASARRMAALIGGSLKLQTRPRRGSAFVLSLKP